MVLAKFRQKYPQGSLVAELIDIDRGTYIVGVSVIVNNIILATSLAGADTVEAAEDLARKRAIALLMLDSQNTTEQNLDSTSSIANKASDLAVATSVRSSTANVSQKQIDTTDHLPHDEDSNVVDFAARSPEETDFAHSVEPQSSSEFEIKTESKGSLLEEEQQGRESGDLFAGTSNPDTVASQDIPADSKKSDPQVSTIDPEPSEFDNIEEINFNEIKHQTDLEIKRLGWTKDDGREFLKSRYGKRSRLQLTDNQLLEFLQYLASQPSPS